MPFLFILSTVSSDPHGKIFSWTEFTQMFFILNWSETAFDLSQKSQKKSYGRIAQDRTKDRGLPFMSNGSEWILELLTRSVAISPAFHGRDGKRRSGATLIPLA
jgi:hypothetical protein